ncbi:MAG: thioredoxin domain-containing protein [Myxococcaceae bacterium]
MLNRFNVLVAVTASVLLACACAKDAKTGSATPAVTAAGAGADQVVATWGNGKKLTMKEVDESKEVFEARQKQIDAMVMNDLLEQEAKKTNQTVEQWFAAQVDKVVPAPSDEEIAKVFASNQAQMPEGATLEKMKPQIKAYLDDQRRQQAMPALQKVVAEIRNQANVKILFHEPKKTVEAVGPSRGPEGAKVTIVEFSDFQCPFCGRVHDTVEKVMESYPGKVRLVFRQFPLKFHEKAPLAAEAALCANEQGQFWQYHDVLFKNQQKLDEADLKAHAATIGLDGAKFADCLSTGRMKKTLEADQAAGEKAGVNGTPAFFINGTPLSGAQPVEAFKEVIDAELAN